MSKSISTHKEDPLTAHTHAAVAVALRDMHPKFYADSRRASLGKYNKRFDTLSRQFSRVLDEYLIRAKAGDERAKRAPLKILEEFYTNAFKYGLAAGGRGLAADTVKLTPADQKWLRSAVREEATYWRKFMREVLAGKSRMSPTQRKEMYVRTLRSVYETGKIMALPEAVLLYWVINSHKENCPHCQFLAKNSPYTKDNLPTTPRSGETQCLSNCGCRIMVHHVSGPEYSAAKAKMPSREELIKQLNSLKR